MKYDNAFISFLLGKLFASSNGSDDNGTLGSSSATTTNPGGSNPAPPPKSAASRDQGKRQRLQTWWPPPPFRAAQGCAHVLMIMTDDQGYGRRGTFGAIPTQALTASLAGCVTRSSVPPRCVLADPGGVITGATITGRFRRDSSYRQASRATIRSSHMKTRPSATILKGNGTPRRGSARKPQHAGRTNPRRGPFTQCRFMNGL